MAGRKLNFENIESVFERALGEVAGSGEEERFAPPSAPTTETPDEVEDGSPSPPTALDDGPKPEGRPPSRVGPLVFEGLDEVAEELLSDPGPTPPSPWTETAPTSPPHRSEDPSSDLLPAVPPPASDPAAIRAFDDDMHSLSQVLDVYRAKYGLPHPEGETPNVAPGGEAPEVAAGFEAKAGSGFEGRSLLEDAAPVVSPHPRPGLESEDLTIPLPSPQAFVSEPPTAWPARRGERIGDILADDRFYQRLGAVFGALAILLLGALVYLLTLTPPSRSGPVRTSRRPRPSVPLKTVISLPFRSESSWNRGALTQPVVRRLLARCPESLEVVGRAGDFGTTPDERAPVARRRSRAVAARLLAAGVPPKRLRTSIDLTSDGAEVIVRCPFGGQDLHPSRGEVP